MDWKEKILNGMELIKEGCENSPADNCSECPFCMFCDLAPFIYFGDEIARVENE